ncbi:unnamed protein product [Chrysoparadoxa australica]
MVNSASAQDLLQQQPSQSEPGGAPPHHQDGPDGLTGQGRRQSAHDAALSELLGADGQTEKQKQQKAAQYLAQQLEEVKQRKEKEKKELEEQERKDEERLERERTELQKQYEEEERKKKKEKELKLAKEDEENRLLVKQRKAAEEAKQAADERRENERVEREQREMKEQYERELAKEKEKKAPAASPASKKPVGVAPEPVQAAPSKGTLSGVHAGGDDRGKLSHASLNENAAGSLPTGAGEPEMRESKASFRVNPSGSSADLMRREGGSKQDLFGGGGSGKVPALQPEPPGDTASGTQTLHQSQSKSKNLQYGQAVRTPGAVGAQHDAVNQQARSTSAKTEQGDALAELQCELSKQKEAAEKARSDFLQLQRESQKRDEQEQEMQKEMRQKSRLADTATALREASEQAISPEMSLRRRKRWMIPHPPDPHAEVQALSEGFSPDSLTLLKTSRQRSRQGGSRNNGKMRPWSESSLHSCGTARDTPTASTYQIHREEPELGGHSQFSQVQPPTIEAWHNSDSSHAGHDRRERPKADWLERNWSGGSGATAHVPVPRLSLGGSMKADSELIFPDGTIRNMDRHGILASAGQLGVSSGLVAAGSISSSRPTTHDTDEIDGIQKRTEARLKALERLDTDGIYAPRLQSSQGRGSSLAPQSGDQLDMLMRGSQPARR